ncbi:Tetratricopeptide repeat protein 1 [Taphrina deformans PYCC 5710]|uniref:Tetratricopeptide repeat protein 1 n=1 Tax=Taphrina deformans (strain PYCC 5710 / ATCC 11124 / CBS 356.35 / IMI 108563 / JCM 9778 / NBRC 8474) TaxID=1097556 RepID=R4X705_TAPDE|nr:Tetratricopeptide repeat protein 1 [Taphrina deformans PYCC 5710]|eukprot:CCG81027.1 Tetratricopeptide repeat protein 1 [Taphrina deformans PYCC 5710]
MTTHPNVIDVPVKGSDQVVTIDCSDLPEDPRDFCAVLSGEEADAKYWIKLAFEYRHIGLVNQAIDILQDGLRSRTVQRENNHRYLLHSFLAALCIQKSREAATGMGKQIDGSNELTKDSWHRQAMTALNDAARLKPLTTSSTLSRGVLAILSSEKSDSYDEANKQFENALRENSLNLFAIAGKARVLFARKNYKLALVHYQKLLRLRPTMVPDPRLGIGLCYWHLDMKAEAQLAWERAVELDSSNTQGAVLLGLYWIAHAFDNVSDERTFEQSYSRGIKLISDAYKKEALPLAGIVLASYMFSRKKMDALQRILQQVLIMAEVPNIRADALFWLARGQHFVESFEQAGAFYALAKQTDPNSLVVSMAIGQMQLVKKDITDAKLTFESILEKHPRCIEALSVLGSIYAHEALDASFKGDKVTHRIKAKACLDKAITLTTDHKQRVLLDPSLHFTRAMLSDDDPVATKIKILQQAADIQLENGSSSSPEILNNMAVVHQANGAFDIAREMYQKAIEECIQCAKDEPEAETDIKIATMTYNLGRLEEHSGNTEAAREIFKGLLKPYPDYVEPAARIAYLDYLDSKVDQSLTDIKDLIDVDSGNVEVRALYGWMLNKQKKNKSLNFNDDPERRHFNHTLKYVDNYERYSLVSLGNFYLKLAREIRADSDAGANERHKHYDMAIKFFERALHYDAKNAYAAQGLAIAFAEHKQYQKAIHIFSKVRESLRDESIFINMGHCFCELHQYSRAIENYETALTTFHQNGQDLYLFLCLGRAWLSRGRDEKNVDHIKEALRYAKMARTESPENTSLVFNVAFIQFQLADILRNTPELKRTVSDLEEAAIDLEEAIRTFTTLGEHKQPPYPRADILQRATMGRNTTTKQLERAVAQQKEYESKNTAKVAEARAKRQAEQDARDAAIREAQQAELVKQEALAQKRKEMLEQARSWAEKRHQEDEERMAKEHEKAAQRKEKKSKVKKQQGEYESDEQDEDPATSSKKASGKARKKRTLRRPKKARAESESETEAKQQSSDSDAQSDTGTQKPSKKRKLTKKYISNEFIDSDEDVEMQDELENEEQGQQYANEAMISEKEIDTGNDNVPNNTSQSADNVPISGDNAPSTNQADAGAGSILLTDQRDHLSAQETPGISVNGVQ